MASTSQNMAASRCSEFLHGSLALQEHVFSEQEGSMALQYSLQCHFLVKEEVLYFLVKVVTRPLVSRGGDILSNMLIRRISKNL